MLLFGCTERGKRFLSRCASPAELAQSTVASTVTASHRDHQRVATRVNLEKTRPGAMALLVFLQDCDDLVTSESGFAYREAY